MIARYSWKTNRIAAFFLALIFFIVSGCAWNPDGTWNPEETWKNITGENKSQLNAMPTEPQDASLISPGKYVDEHKNWFTIKKGTGKNEWRATVYGVGVSHTDKGKRYYDTSEDFTCYQNQNKLICPLYEDCEMILTQIDKNTIDGKTVGPISNYYGTAGGPEFPDGIYKKK